MKARWFLQAIRPPYGLLGAELAKQGFEAVGETFEIELRFLRLYDTVVSDMIVKERLIPKAGMLMTAFNNAFGPLVPILGELIPKINYDISALAIQKVFHLTAENEWRENFALTPSGKDYSLSILGCHSDIGGGYAQLDEYGAILDFFDVPVDDTKLLAEKERLRNYYHHHWYGTEEDIQLMNTYDHIEQEIDSSFRGKRIITPMVINAPPGVYKDGQAYVNKDRNEYGVLMIKKQKKISGHYLLKDNRRFMLNKYSLVSLQLMLHKAIDHGVPFYEDYEKAEPKPPYEFEYNISDADAFKGLKAYLAIMLAISKEEKGGTYALPHEIYKEMARRYVHLSAHFGGLTNDFLTIKSGDHHWLGKLGFVNQPVVPIQNEGGEIIYKRPLWPQN